MSKFRQQLADYLDIPENHVTLYWKGRVALYAILKAMGIGHGDEIILPGFTCVVVSNPIKYLGAKPVYVDIDTDTYNMDISLVEEKITPATKVILAQNTFGLSSDLDSIMALAEKYNLKVIEDCAHGFGGFYKGRKNGTIAHASFFSTQWNKPFSTGIGGIAVTCDPVLAKDLKKGEETALKPSFKHSFFLRCLVFVKNMVPESLYWLALNTYRTLSEKNLIIGSSQGYELERPEIPENFFTGFSRFQEKVGSNQLKQIENIMIHRKNIAEKYKSILGSLDIQAPFEPDYAVHTYLKFPLFVKNRNDFLKKAEKAGVELGDWFVSPIHPIEEEWDRWDYFKGSCPVGEAFSRHIVNLHTHTGIKDRQLDKIEKFLRQNSEFLLNQNGINLVSSD